MKYTICLLFCLGLAANLLSQSATILDNTNHVHVLPDSTLEVRNFLQIRINNLEGQDYALQKLYYRQDIIISDIKATIKNSAGKTISRIKKSEIQDLKAYTEYFHTDLRYKEIDLRHNTFPYIIELEYVEQYKDLFHFPKWHPQMGYKHVSTEKSTFSITTPKGFDYEYKFYNFTPVETKFSEENQDTRTWEVKNLSKLNSEKPYGIDPKNLYPHGIFKSKSFHSIGYQGSFESWKDLGNWYSKVTDGLDELSEDEIKKVQEMVSGIRTDEEKMKILYKYLQENTRYINVSIGDGGYKPYNANYVCSNKYGDCKALSNYMKALLKATGIKSHLALINADSDADFDTGFVVPKFNHLVLVVPREKDSIWLECTTQHLPYGYWGTFTEGENALVCNGAQSKLANQGCTCMFALYSLQ